jgi:hypothetical protein
MEEAPENGKESSHSAHANGIGIGIVMSALVSTCADYDFNTVPLVGLQV